MTLEDGNFSFASEPHPIKIAKKTKFRAGNSQSDSKIPLNMMSDPRVVRGYASVLDRQNKLKASTSKPESILKKKIVVEEKIFSQPYYEFSYNSGIGENFNLEEFLVEQTDPKGSHHIDQKTQTDEFQQLPPTPKYVPRKTGVDQSTQIEDITELFDFDKEIAPIVYTLTMKTIEQANFEIKCEEELAAMEKLQVSYNEIEETHQQWVREELRRTQEASVEMAVIVEANMKRHENVLKVRKYVAGQQFMQQIYTDVIESIMKNMFKEGHWVDSDRETCKEVVLPSLMSALESRETAHSASIAVLDDILHNVIVRYDERKKIPLPKSASKFISIAISLESNALEESNENANELPIESLVIGPIPLDQTITVDLLHRVAKARILEKSATAEKEVTLKRVREFFCNLLNREVASDAPLLNFDLPTNTTVSL